MTDEPMNESNLDYFVHIRLTINELRRFTELGNKSDEELLAVADRLYEIAILAQTLR